MVNDITPTLLMNIEHEKNSPIHFADVRHEVGQNEDLSSNVDNGYHDRHFNSDISQLDSVL